MKDNKNNNNTYWSTKEGNTLSWTYNPPKEDTPLVDFLQTTNIKSSKDTLKQNKTSKRDLYEQEIRELVKNAFINVDSHDINNFHLRELAIDRKGMKEFDGDNYRFYTNTIDFKPGINLLFGGNGQGKSSLIEYLNTLSNSREPMGSDKSIFKFCRLTKTKDDIKVYSFVNRKNNASYFDGQTLNEDLFVFNSIRKLQSSERSEGQSVIQSLSDFFYVIDRLDANTKAVVLMDEIDSGLDACMCNYLVKRLKKLISLKPNLQIFIAFNQYEISKLDKEWVNICTGEIENCPKTYEEYYKRLSNNKQKFKRKVDKEIRK